MAMLGQAAMLLWYDIVPEEVAQHDEWHTREHFPERTGIPGFLRAARWVAQGTTIPRYLVSYEVRDAEVLTSDAYLARLNEPSPWTQRIMPHFRGMVRGFFRIERCGGEVLGAQVLAIRHAPVSGRAPELGRWIGETALPALSRLPGFASACSFSAAGTAPMTEEQRLRGRDATVERVLLATGYSTAFIEEASVVLAPEAMMSHGAAPGVLPGHYQLACTELAARRD